MRHIRIYTEGDVLGNYGMIFLRETDPRDYNGKFIRSADFKCHCGKVFNTVIARVKNNRLKSCGCFKLKLFLSNITKHGLSEHPIYWVWKHIRERTANKTHRQYKHYGGRGILMFPPWREDFQLFYDYVSALPHFKEKGYSIDRIDNDGSYEPGNLRWTVRHIQNVNRRTLNRSTGYRAVYRESKNTWSFSVGKYKQNGFYSLTDAVTARNNYIFANKLFEYKTQEVR